MKAMVADAMANGAIGLGASYSLNHSGYGGVPMPSTIAPMSELEALVGAMGPRGRGVVEIASGVKTPQECSDRAHPLTKLDDTPATRYYHACLLEQLGYYNRALNVLEVAKSDTPALADPITGEGIFYALRSGQLLAEVITNSGSPPASTRATAEPRGEPEGGADPGFAGGRQVAAQ